MSAQVPQTPRVISPTPPPDASSNGSTRDGYFAPITRSATSKQRDRVASPIEEEQDASGGETSDSSLERRARSRSRSPVLEGSKRRRMSGLAAITPKSGMPSAAAGRSGKKKDKEAEGSVVTNGKTTSNGHLSPSSASSSYWRDFSRSPSPLGLIPIHRHWRSFIHRHEIPRKALHVSIGFFTVWLYTRGVQPTTITPWLLIFGIPIASTDVLRHQYPPFNRFYIRCLGALMRESEVSGYNGVIWYLLGAYLSLTFFPKDIGVMSVLLLSWCDTAASTFGRLYGRYTPRLRRGKSLAGSLAAALVGFATAVGFWGWVVPRCGIELRDGFLFKGQLSLPEVAKVGGLLRWQGNTRGVVEGGWALGLVGVWAGVVASVSEVVDLWGWDDNLTIPVLSGVGLWGFLKVFGT
ncbi:MAG: hypothetical protein M1812_006276 [Candelaria pacifica]|nr:MAG: hypothetical protein M1812_006276 [Candelaria pacifica]